MPSLLWFLFLVSILQFSVKHNRAANTTVDNVLWALSEMFLYFFDAALNHAISWAVDEFIPQSVFDSSTNTTMSASTSAPCPTGKDQPACEDNDCAGDDIVATCTAAGPKSKCSCAPLVTPFVNSVDVAWLRGQQTLLGSMISVGKSMNPPKPTLSCADDSPAHLDRDWAIGSVSSFCNSYMGKNASPNMPIEQNYAEGTQENFDNGVGQNTTLSIVVAPECSQNFTQYNIDIDQCNVALNSTIEECDTTGPKDGKHGGKVSYGCIVYANDPQTHPPSPSSTDSSTPSPSADSSHCSINDDCNFRTCPIGPSTCETYGAPGVNEQGLK